MAKIYTVPKWSMFGYGLTLYKLVFIREDVVDYEYVKQHELIHVEQWTRIGFFKFMYLYLKELYDVGYFENKYEVEARFKGSINSRIR
ncbi:hypothetical protein OAE88_00665 [bacterium]|nr:hypothetical protein [bacterium]